MSLMYRTSTTPCCSCSVQYTVFRNLNWSRLRNPQSLPQLRTRRGLHPDGSVSTTWPRLTFVTATVVLTPDEFVAVTVTS